MKRLWIIGSVLLITALLLTACPAPTPQVIEKIVEKTVVVEQTVAVPQTVEVEKIVEMKVEVTPEITPAPEQLSGTLIVGRGGDSVILDVGPATDGESWRVITDVNEPLIRLEGTSTKPIPWLAES